MQTIHNHRLTLLTRKRYRRMTLAGRFWTLYAVLVLLGALALVDWIGRAFG